MIYDFYYPATPTLKGALSENVIAKCSL